MDDTRWTKTRLTSALVTDVVEGIERETLAKWVPELAAEVLKARTMLANSSLASVRRIKALEARLTELEGELRTAIRVIEGLADQQAMADDWYETSLVGFRAVLATEGRED